MDSLGIEATRKRLPELVTAASRGEATMITKHGRPYAAIVPIELARAGNASLGALLNLKGCAPGVWGHEPARTVAALRDEWDQ